MKATQFQVKRIDYSYHPNFVQDDNEPRGYRLTGGGKWVAEWDAVAKGTEPIKLHFRREFDTELGASRFCARLQKGLDEHQSVMVNNDNAYYLGQ